MTSGKAGGLACEPLKAVSKLQGPPKGGYDPNNPNWSIFLSISSCFLIY